MSSVEELVLQAKQGGETGELWQRLERLIYQWCRPYQNTAVQQGLELSDLINTAYIAMIQAVQAYDPLRGCKFTTLLKFYVRRHIWQVLGLQNRIQTVSLDEPIREGESTALVDIIQDTESEKAFAEIENKGEFETIKTEVDKLPYEQRRVIQGAFFDDKTQAELCEELNAAPRQISRIKSKALQSLRGSLAVSSCARKHTAKAYKSYEKKFMDDLHRLFDD